MAMVVGAVFSSSSCGAKAPPCVLPHENGEFSSPNFPGGWAAAFCSGSVCSPWMSRPAVIHVPFINLLSCARSQVDLAAPMIVAVECEVWTVHFDGVRIVAGLRYRKLRLGERNDVNADGR